MLAMHYRIPLGGPDPAAAIRRRVIERGPLFDGMPGLAHKFFLYDPERPTYATFYLWREAEAARAFLEGPLFAALRVTFGRPVVHLLLATGIELPCRDPAVVTLTEGWAGLRFGTRIDAVDPLDGTPLSLRFDDAARGRRFELLYHARESAPALPARATVSA